LDDLRAELDRRVAAQLPALRQRMQVAEDTAPTDPHRAHRIYQAIVDLYGEQQWAGEIVTEARKRLNSSNHTD
jgi:hypothetical protein